MKHIFTVRNAYLYVNMGDFIDGSNNTADPYLQLLSVTNDTAKAHQDFVQVRGSKTTGNAEEALSKSSIHNPSLTSSKNKSMSKVKKIIIAVVIAGVLALVLFGVLVWCCCCRNRGKRSSKATFTAAYPDTSYQHLNAPAPDAATDVHATQDNPQYTPQAAPYNSQPYPPYDPPAPLKGGYQTPYEKQY